MKHPRIVAIINPTSGGGSTNKKIEKFRNDIDRILGRETEIKLTVRKGEGTTFATAAIKNRASTIIAIGGDGTANEILNGFFKFRSNKATPVNLNSVMAFIPSGTRNVLAKSAGLPKGFIQNLEAIRRKKPRTLDVILARVLKQPENKFFSRVFLNAAEIGLGAHIIDRSRKIREVVNSRALSTLATVMATVPTYRSNECEVSFDGGSWTLLSPVTLCAVSNGPYLGGNFKMAPRASMSDGRLDLTVIKDSGSLKLLRQLYNMKTGKFANDKNVIYEQAKKVAIRSKDREVKVTVDGETIGSLPATFEVIPKTLKFI